MIKQSGSRAIPRMDLGVALMEFIDNQNDFVGSQVFPAFKTQVKAATYSAITRESLAQTADTKRSTRGNYNRGGFTTKDKNYSCEENGYEQLLGDDERKQYANDFDAELIASMVAEGVVLRNQEARIAAKVFDTAVFTGSDLYTDNSGTPWSTAATDIKAQVDAGMKKVRSNCGMLPNALIINYNTLCHMLKNTALIGAVQPTKFPARDVLESAIAAWLGVKKLIVAKAIKNSSNQGKAFVAADIWSNLYAMLAIIAEDGQNLAQPTLGRTFMWVEDCPDNVFVEQYRDDPARSDVFRTRQHTDEILVDPYFGHLLKVVTS
jgi:hypothetical protein